jgi:peroxiredoxin
MHASFHSRESRQGGSVQQEPSQPLVQKDSYWLSKEMRHRTLRITGNLADSGLTTMSEACRHTSLLLLLPPTFLGYTLPMGILRRLSRWMGKQDHMTHIIAGNTAPGFSLKSLDNKEYSLATLMERGPVVAAFFKISCPVCQFTLPFLERLYKRYGGDRVTFLGISQDDARSTNKFAKECGITFPIVLDDENGYLVSNAYGLTNVPTVFLIDADGAVKVSSMGFDKKDLEEIAADLAERKKITLAPLFRPDEVVPANKPG